MKNNWMCNNFVPCGGTTNTITLADIKPSAGFKDSTISFLAPEGPVMAIDDPEYGEIDATYVYVANAALTEAGVAGWYTQYDYDEGCYYPKNDVIIPFGQGMTVYASGSEVGTDGLTFSGIVYDKAVPLKITSMQNNWFGNCSPVAITLGDITVSSGFKDSSLSFLAPEGPVKTIDDPEYGEIDATYVYVANAALTEAGVAGWYTQYDYDEGCYYPKNDELVPAGIGFTVYASGTEIGESIVIPAAN